MPGKQLCFSHHVSKASLCWVASIDEPGPININLSSLFGNHMATTKPSAAGSLVLLSAFAAHGLLPSAAFPLEELIQTKCENYPAGPQVGAVDHIVPHSPREEDVIGAVAQRALPLVQFRQAPRGRLAQQCLSKSFYLHAKGKYVQ